MKAEAAHPERAHGPGPWRLRLLLAVLALAVIVLPGMASDSGAQTRRPGGPSNRSRPWRLDCDADRPGGRSTRAGCVITVQLRGQLKP